MERARNPLFAPNKKCESSSVAERFFAKEEGVGADPMFRSNKYEPLAQRVELWSLKPKVAGATPVWFTN